MSDTFRLTLAQLNPTVGGAIVANCDKARAAWAEARAAGADMIAFTEAFVTGYQTQDLVMRPQFYRDAMAAVDALAADCADGPVIGIGAPFHDGDDLYNAYYILKGGKIAHRVLKQCLPNETVFDEVRHFTAAHPQGPYSVGPIRIGTPICEDAWHAESVCETLEESGGAEFLLIPPNGSPPYFRGGKYDVRMNHMVGRVVETGLPLIYLNMVGGQDDQIFDGGTFALNPGGGELALRLPVFDEALAHVDLTRTNDVWRMEKGELAPPLPDDWEQDYRAMVESLRDYCGKTGFGKVLLGLSGGIDSAIVATIAADALGPPENVRCVMLPSEYTSQAHWRTPRTSRHGWAAPMTSCRSAKGVRPSPIRWPPPSSKGWSRTRPKKTSSRACAACC